MRAGEPPHHAVAAAAVAAGLGTDIERGLDPTDAERRLETFGHNVLREPTPESQWRRLGRQFADPLVYLLLVAIAISLVVWIIDSEELLPLDAIVIGAIVIANAAIGFMQERRADNAVAELRRLIAAKATVIRGGSATRIDVADIVPGDLVALREGDVIPADGRLTLAEGLCTAEAALTGESQPVNKITAPLPSEVAVADRTNSVFAATAVATGTGRMIVTGTGMDTEVGAIADMLEATSDTPTPLEREVARVGRTLGITVLVLATVLVITTFAVSEVDTAAEAVELLLVGVSLAVAAVPEGLPAVLSLVLALGVGRMAKRNALLKRLAFAETLGSTTVICSDKTGTLTQNTMTAEVLATSDGEIQLLTGLDGALDRSAVIIDLDAEGHTVWHSPTLAALAAAALASDAEPMRGDAADRAGAPTELALVDAATNASIDVDALRTTFPRLRVVPFDSIRKRMTTVHESNGEVLTITKGAPDVVLPLCSHVGSLRDVAPLDREGRAHWDRVVEELADRALRTLAVAAHVGPGPTAGDSDPLTLLGIVGIIDPPRPAAVEAVRTARDAGIRVVMITGDHPRTAARIAADVGIGTPEARAVVGSELDGDDAELEALVETTDVFARVDPRHKLRLVETLQRQGHVVAMTGDGVNDAPALKAADIGIAMGITGSDVSKGAADMILTDDNFATIVAAVEEGRSIFANVRAFMRYLLSSNMGEVLTMFLGVALASVIGLEVDESGVIAPLAATQILWINLLTDTGPALALGVDPVDHAVMAEGPRGPADRLVDRTMLTTIAILGLTMAVASLVILDVMLPGGLVEGDQSFDTARTGVFTVLVLAQLFNAFATRSEHRSAFRGLFSNLWLVGAVLMSLGLQVVVVHHPAFNDAFSTVPLSLSQWLLATALASSILWVSEVRSFLRRRSAP